jgi:hypothetical protein
VVTIVVSSLPRRRTAFVNVTNVMTTLHPILSVGVRGYIQNFPDWPPGARTANGAVVSLFCESV